MYQKKINFYQSRAQALSFGQLFIFSQWLLVMFWNEVIMKSSILNQYYKICWKMKNFTFHSFHFIINHYKLWNDLASYHFLSPQYIHDVLYSWWSCLFPFPEPLVYLWCLFCIKWNLQNTAFPIQLYGDRFTGIKVTEKGLLL